MHVRVGQPSKRSSVQSVALYDHQWGGVDLFRQTYNYNGKAGNTIFARGDEFLCDYAIVRMNAEPCDSAFAIYPKERRILLAMENPSIWRISSCITSQCGIIVSPFEDYNINGSHFIKSHAAVPWFYGIDFDCHSGLLHRPEKCNSELSALFSKAKPIKDRLLSIIISGKSSSPGYAWRQHLALKLKEIFAIDCDIYGFGHNPIPDKSSALDRYIFTVVIENESHSHYWTEKLADSYLAFTYPIYAGDPRVQDDFPGRVSTIPFGVEPLAAAKIITNIISEYSADYDRVLLENRNAVMMNHNLFYMIDNLIGKL